MAKPSPISVPGSRDVLSQGKEVHFPAKTFSFPCRYAPIVSVTSPAFYWSPQLILLTPSHHKILQREAEQWEWTTLHTWAPRRKSVKCEWEQWGGAFWQGALALKHVSYIMNILLSAKWFWPWIRILEEQGRVWNFSFFSSKTKTMLVASS